MTPVVLVGAAVIGLAVGSFLNVVIHRVPAGLSVVRPASACPGCGTEIRARDNIPVLSWILLRGRCRNCGTGISLRYPLVEAGTGLAFVAVAVYFLPRIDAALGSGLTAPGAFLELLAFLALAALTIALAIIDIEVQRLPNPIVLTGYIIAIVLLLPAALLLGRPEALLTALIGGAALFVFYLVVALIYPGGMGFGDVKLAGLLGLYLGYLGWPELIVGAFAAFLLGGIAALVLVLARHGGRKTRLPFGPFMLGGAWVGVVVGKPVAAGYLSVTGLA